MTIILKKNREQFCSASVKQNFIRQKANSQTKVIHLEFNEQGDFHLAEMQKSAMILAIGYWPNGRESGWA